VALWALLPVVCSALVGSAVMLLQGGGLRVVAITLKFDRLHPLEGMKRMFSREALVGSARAIVAVACAAGVIVPALVQLLDSGSEARPAQLLAQTAWAGAIRCAFSIAVLGAAFGSVDFGLAVAKWRKKLRMSFDEVKRDHKEQEGDPAAKSRRRAMYRDISRGSLKRLKDAAFVVVNPTHIAIALEYGPPAVTVPRVLIKAAGEIAVRVRERAAVLNVPVIENIALARSLYASTRAGEVIPKESYIAVAEIVAALAKSGVLS
ncbi:MAG: EscU/YscU/HrcU family type III secretion system export apparatus switch protein, partial [Candidatus Eremiobacteraeota bacterium]|nr:EscU/YscU/HrcU family type III secretion system export apparatus switch protein [Candidatus Eremiobacteraeota bacterium]